MKTSHVCEKLDAITLYKQGRLTQKELRRILFTPMRMKSEFWHGLPPTVTVDFSKLPWEGK